MDSKKKNIITGILLVMVVGLMGAVFYISYLLTNTTPQSPTATAPKKIKASNVSYTKLLALNQTSGNSNVPPPTDTPSVVPTDTPNPSETVLALNNQGVTQPASQNVTQAASKSGSIEITNSVSGNSTASTSATSIKTLPTTGLITNSLIITAAAGLLLFFAFLF